MQAPPEGRAIVGKLPPAVRAVAQNAPADALVGIGTAAFNDLGMAHSFAQSRAIVGISRQVGVIVRDMERAFNGENDPVVADFFDRFHSASTGTRRMATVTEYFINDRAWVVVQEDGFTAAAFIAIAEEALAESEEECVATADAVQRMREQRDTLARIIGEVQRAPLEIFGR